VTPAVDIRPVVPSDDALLAALARSRWSHLPLPELIDLQDRAQRAAYIEQWGAAGDHIIEVDGLAVGRVWWADTATGRTIVDLALLPNLRGAGIGSQVVAELVAEAGDRAVHCTVDITQRAWYDQLVRLGFCDVGGDDVLRHLTLPGKQG
jgi:GNAT superfamily N-acetyltransferase